jgi:hypothetical protein
MFTFRCCVAKLPARAVSNTCDVILLYRHVMVLIFFKLSSQSQSNITSKKLDVLAE